MKLLLDTHVFLWWVKEDKKLSKNLMNKIKEAEEVYVSRLRTSCIFDC